MRKQYKKFQFSLQSFSSFLPLYHCLFSFLSFSSVSLCSFFFSSSLHFLFNSWLPNKLFIGRCDCVVILIEAGSCNWSVVLCIFALVNIFIVLLLPDSVLYLLFISQTDVHLHVFSFSGKFMKKQIKQEKRFQKSSCVDKNKQQLIVRN